MAPNQNDVARAAGVSNATVSRVLNDSPSVTDETKRHVRATMNRMSYTPNVAARQLKRRQSDSIGVVITQIATGFFASVMNGISQEAQRRKYTTVFAVATIEDKCRTIYRSMLEGSRVDGLIILEPWLRDEQIEDLETLNRPIVLIQRQTNSSKVGSVSIDNRKGALTGMRYLIDGGHRHILVVRGPEAAQDAREREQGCRQAVHTAGREDLTVDYISGHFRADQALDVYRRYRRHHPLPDAVFALNDTMAASLLKEMQRDGIRVPEEVAILGFDGTETADFFDLSTITTPITEMGQRAIELVLEQLTEPEKPARHVQLDGVLTIRATT